MEICKHAELCGGCVYQGSEYAQQVESKGAEILRILNEKGVNAENYLGIEGSPMQCAYRNKMEYTFGNVVKDGEMTLGMHQRGRFMSVITVDECQLVSEDFNEILKTTLSFFTERGMTFFHKKSHEGLLRNLIIRKGERTNELLINLVTTSQSGFDRDDYVAALLGLNLENTIVGVLNTINDNIADAVKCDRLDVLYGRDYYYEEILDLKFKVSAFSFFQTNIAAVERLYSEALALIDNVEGKTVFDLYCGTGTITQALATRARNVFGVEIVEEAVAAARENALMNGLENTEFIAGDVMSVLDELNEKPDVIVIDPPRIGIHYKALPKITSYGVNQILYISCNPKTMADNLKFMENNGYIVKNIKGYDNFPFTKHTEAVALLEKR